MKTLIKGVIPNEPNNISNYDVMFKLKIVNYTSVYNPVIIPLISFDDKNSANI